MIDGLKKGLAKLTPAERQKLGKAIGPDADALLVKAFGEEVMQIFSKPRLERMKKGKAPSKKPPMSMAESLMGGAQQPQGMGPMSRALMGY